MGSMSASDAAPLPRLGDVFFDVRGSSRSMRLSWYANTGVAVFSIWQGGTCTGTFRLPMDDLSRMVEALQRGPHGSPEDSAVEQPFRRQRPPSAESEIETGQITPPIPFQAAWNQAGEHSRDLSASGHVEAPPAPYGEAPPAPYGEAPPAPYGEAPHAPYGEAPPAPYGEAPPAPYGGARLGPPASLPSAYPDVTVGPAATLPPGYAERTSSRPETLPPAYPGGVAAGSREPLPTAYAEAAGPLAESTPAAYGAGGYGEAPLTRPPPEDLAARGYSGEPAARGYSGEPAARGYSGEPAAGYPDEPPRFGDASVVGYRADPLAGDYARPGSYDSGPARVRADPLGSDHGPDRRLLGGEYPDAEGYQNTSPARPYVAPPGTGGGGRPRPRRRTPAEPEPGSFPYEAHPGEREPQQGER